MEENKEQKETTPVAPVETPTQPTVTIESLLKEKADLETKLAQTTKGLETAHGTLRDKDIRLRKVGDLEDKIASLEEIVKLATGFMVQNQGKTDGDFEVAKTQNPADLKKNFDALVAKREIERKTKNQQQEITDKLADIKSRVEALGLTEADDAYWEIKSDAVFATPEKFELAERKLKKLEALKEANKAKETPTENKETDEQRIERLAAQKSREYLEKQGLLKPEGTKPTGGSGGLTPEAVAKMSPDERYARRKEIASMPLTNLNYTK